MHTQCSRSFLNVLQSHGENIIADMSAVRRCHFGGVHRGLTIPPDITKLVRKIRKLRVGETSAIHTQCARPTRTPPRMKRKFHMDDDGSTSILDRAKRAKDESES